jgi:two-component system chemotaxis response regulator CheB
VTIAGSAGGLEPLSHLLAELPFGFNAAVVAMLHTGPGSVLAEMLRDRSKLPLSSGKSGQLLKAGHVYVAPQGTHVIVNPDARLTISAAPRLRHFRPSADWLFESAAASFGDRHMAIVLSGRLSDGATKLRTVKRLGGTVFVQSPGDAIHPEMPTAAIATGLVDFVVPVSDMARAVCDLLSRRDAERDAAMWESPFVQAALPTEQGLS